MIDLLLYRQRIGTFTSQSRKIKFLRKSKCCESSVKAGHYLLSTVKILMKIVLILVLIPCPWPCISQPKSPGKFLSNNVTTPDLMATPPFIVKSRKQTSNFQARYIHGNPPRGIKNMHLNIRSLGMKVFEIRNIVKEYKPHILGLSECELKKVAGIFDESKLEIPGYSLHFPKSWSCHGFARVLVYVKDTLEYEQVGELEDNLAQSVWIRASFMGSKKAYFCHLYRKYTSTLGNSVRAQRISLETLLSQWETATTLGNPDNPNETHISGDMNLDCLDGKWLRPDYHLVSLSRIVQTACNTSNFSQLVTSPTRSQFNRARNMMDISLIDHVYCNTKFRCSKVSVHSFGNSDHDLIGYTRFSKEPRPPACTVRKRSYKAFEQDLFLADLANVDWGQVYSCRDVDAAVTTFTRLFQSILNTHAPWITFQQRKHFAPWLTESTKLLMKQRDEWKEAAKKLAVDNPGLPASDDQLRAWNEYKKLRNTINNRKRDEERKYKHSKVLENIDSPEKTWRTAKEFMEWKHQGPPHQLQVGHQLVTRARVIAQHMNEFFIDKVLKIREGLKSAVPNLSSCLSIMEGKTCKLSLSHVNVAKVEKLLKKLKNTKSTAVDELDNFCIKISAEIIAQPLHHIISLSIMQCKFPTSWKFSKIVPLHKNDSVLDSKNYRPVAILSPLGKILEKIIFEQLYSYFSSNKIFHPNIHGYRHQRSTQTALLQMYDRWVRAAHQGGVTGVVLLDLSAAFDLVDHQILLDKLKIYGLQPDFCEWVRCYLTDRHQAVWLRHCFSSFLPCSVGVPQGSNLGPLFFLIFYNDLPFSLNCEFEAYADDSTMSLSGKNTEIISELLTSNCAKVNTWMGENKFKLNATKTHFLTVGTSVRVDSLANPVEVVMDGIKLKEVAERSEKLLGVYIQYNLKWQRTLEELRKKLKKRLAGLQKIRSVVPFHQLKIITQGIFNSILVYCLPLYGGCNKGDLESVQVLQNKAAQIVTKSPPRSERNPIFDKLDWLSVNQLIAYHTLLQAYKIRESKEPEYLYEIFSKENRNGNIIVTNTDLSLAKISFTFRGSELWNSLPGNIKTSQKISIFKKACRKWVKDTVPRFCT